MTLKNSIRLYKHYMGNLKADGFTVKPVQKVEADRVVDRSRIYYREDGTPKNKAEVLENGPGFDVVGAAKPKEEPKKVEVTKSKSKK